MQVYIIRNKEGKYLRTIGYGGGGKCWVDDIKNAKLYLKLGAARGRVTFFYKKYPQYGCPELLEYTLENPNVIDMQAETVKKIDKIKARELARQTRSAAWQVQFKEKELARLQAELKKLKGN